MLSLLPLHLSSLPAGAAEAQGADGGPQAAGAHPSSESWAEGAAPARTAQLLGVHGWHENALGCLPACAPCHPCSSLGPQAHQKPICAATIRMGPSWMEVPFYATQESRRNKGAQPSDTCWLRSLSVSKAGWL